MPDTPRSLQAATMLTRIAGALAACIGLAALITTLPAWHVDDWFWQPIPHLGTIGLVLGGVGLIATARRKPAWGIVAGCLLGALGTAALVRHGLTHLHPQFATPTTIAAHLLLTLTPPTALSFTLGGLALLLGYRPVTRGWKPATIATLGSIVLALALVSLLLHTLDAGRALDIGYPTRLPPLLATGLLFLGLGTMGYAASLSPLNRARRASWLPISLGLGLATFTFVVWRALSLFDHMHLEHVLATSAIAFRTQIVSQMRAEADSLQRMANRWEVSGGTPRELWEADASAFVADQPGIFDVLWVDAALTPSWGIPVPADEPRIRALADNPRLRDVLITARDSRRAAISPGFSLNHRAHGFFIAVPIFIEGRFDGLLVSVIRVQEFLDSVLTDSVLQGFDIVVADGQRSIYGPRKARDTANTVASVRIELSRLNWQLYVVPQPGSTAASPSALPEATIVVGLLVSALVTLSVHLGQTAAQRARELEIANRELEHRVAARTAELTRALADLEHSNQELEQFAYVASHDLQEPLRMVSSYVQLLARRYQGRLDADADTFIRYAVDGAERMKRLINDLLAYSRLGTQAKPHRSVDCNVVLQEALGNLALALREAGGTLDVAPLPLVRGDETQLLQVFQNLVGNAIKFRGTTPLRVQVTAVRAKDFWCLTVRDNGIGIDPQHAERIFVIFRRLHTQDQYPGTGIGLAVCRKIVERHGGRIWVESAPGAGAAFHFTLRAAHNDPPEGPAPPEDRWKT